MKTQRTYLYCPPEEYAQVKRAGAHWDDERKCWYIVDNQDTSRFARWLGPFDEGTDELCIESSKAFVVIRETECWHCDANIEVIGIYCKSGKIDGESYKEFTVSSVTAVDDVLKEQLKKWPNFHLAEDPDIGSEYFLNHCPECGAPQSDFMLHCEPGGPFFSIKGARKGSIKFVSLKGKVRLNGNEGFEL